MAHQLFQHPATGQYSFMSVQQTAWHGLGQIVTDYPTSAEAMQYAGLDFTVEKRLVATCHLEANTANPDAQVIVPHKLVSERFATVRTDLDIPLGIVGKDYHVVQNRDAFSFFDSIVGGDGIQYETCGAINEGRTIFITAKLPGYINVGNGDLINNYLFLTTSHDGSGSITAAFTPVRIVCANTLAAAMGNHTNAIRIRHTIKATERLEQAHKVMGITNHLSHEMESIFNDWAKVRITDLEVQKLIRLAMVPNREVLQKIHTNNIDELSTTYVNMCDAVFDYAMASPTQQYDTTKGTLFGAYNAVTGYFQNVRNYTSSEAKIKSILFGGAGQLRTQAAFNICTEFAKSGSDAFRMN